MKYLGLHTLLVLGAFAVCLTPILCQESQSTTTENPDTFTCPELNGFYADPENCSCFYQCVNGIPYHFVCQTGLYFNNATGKCDYDYDVTCTAAGGSSSGTAGTQPGGSGTSSTPSSTSSQGGSFACPEANGAYSDSTNCSCYYQCVNNIAYLHCCYPGLYYNNDTGVCDYEDNVPCATSPENSTSGTSGTRVTVPQTTAAPTQTNTQATQFWFTCPEANGDYSNPYNCSCYFECVNNYPYTLCCYPGLYYNNATGLCDYEDNVSCLELSTNPSASTQSLKELRLLKHQKYGDPYVLPEKYQINEV